MSSFNHQGTVCVSPVSSLRDVNVPLSPSLSSIVNRTALSAPGVSLPGGEWKMPS